MEITEHERVLLVNSCDTYGKAHEPF